MSNNDKPQTFNVLIGEKYVGRDKVERTGYFQVGTAWPTKDGEGLRVHLAPGVSVTGDFVILPRKEREAADGDGTAPATGSRKPVEELEDEIPF